MNRARWKARAWIGAVMLSVSFLAFLAGASVVRFRWWPTPLLHRWFMAARALKFRLSSTERFGPYFYRPARTERTGVLQHDPDQAFDGLTVFTSGHAQKALLLSMAGEVVHEWQAPFSSLWDDPPHIDGDPVADELVSMRKAHLFANGDLLVTYAAAGATPWGYGLAKLDYRSRPLWTFADRVHHDVTVGADGTIYTLTHRIIREPLEGLPARLRQPWIEDFVVVLTADGTETSRVGVTAAFRRSRFAGLLETPEPNLEGDLWHTNAVEPVTEALARRLDGVEPGQALISMRRAHCLAVIDLERETVVWAALGPWRAQHDPDILPDGSLLLFDNLGHLGPEGPSRVLELDPATLAIQWQYVGTVQAPLATTGRGSQQRLPNGNTLITESYAGRLVEVTRQGTIVWEYASPFRAPHNPSSVAIVHEAERWETDELTLPTPPAP